MVEQKVRGSSRPAGRTLWGRSVAVCLSTALCAACGGGEEEAKYPAQPPPQPPPQAQPQAQPQQPQAQPQQQPQAQQPAPGQQPGQAPGGAAAQPLDAAALQALKVAIEARAATEAKGMKPAGEAFGGNVPAGGQFESPQMMIDLGKCYTVIAQGGPGLTEVDVQIAVAVPTPMIPSPVVAVDNTTGINASISPCWKNAYPVGFPGKVVLKATGGSGPIAGQVYVK